MTAELPSTYDDDRRTLQRLAVHVLARRRQQATGRIGLRAVPGGIATPAWGDAVEVVRWSGGAVVHEADGRTRSRPLAGSTLRDLAELVGADLDAELSVGGDTPALGDPDAAFALDPASGRVVADWFALGAAALDAAVAELGDGAAASAVQLWPEHLDVACDVAWDQADPERARANLGCSPGDDGHPEPYLYVGPWGDERPGGEDAWDAAFGATRSRSSVLAAADPLADATAFVLSRMRLLEGSRPG